MRTLSVTLLASAVLLVTWAFSPAPNDVDPPVDAEVTMNWQEMPGNARDIGAGPDGSVWIVGMDRSIYRWNQERFSWAEASGSKARRIDVAADETPWITNTDDDIFKFRGGNWQEMPGTARDIGIGDETVWITGSDKSIYRWNEESFDWGEVSGSGDEITVDDDGNPWIINEKNDIFKYQGGNWQEMPGAAIDIAAGPDGSVWIVGTNESIYKWSEDGFDWRQVSGTARRITVQDDGTPWIVNDSNDIYKGRGL